MAMVALLEQQGFAQGRDLMWVSDPHGEHNEACWARRLGPALEFLFPGPGRAKTRAATRRLKEPPPTR